MDSSSNAVDNILDSLDKHVSPELNDRYGLKMNYFRCLYSYYGKCQYLTYLILSEAIKKISKLYNLTEVIFYDYKFNIFIDTKTSLRDAAPLLSDSVNTSVITNDMTRKSKSGLKPANILKRIRQRPLHMLEQLLSQLRAQLHYRFFSENKKTILLYEHLYELDFLINRLNKYNIISYNRESGVPAGFKAKEYVSDVSVDYSKFNDETDNQVAHIFLSDLKSDFDINIKNYLNAVLLLRGIQKKLPISLGIWGLGPTNRLKAFMFEYLKSESIAIIGAQHGCLFGDSYMPKHFDAELCRCTKFVSYGFSEEDLMRLYPNKGQHAEIVPLGKVKLPKPNTARKTVDILFPVTSTISMLEGGMDTTLPHELTNRQIDILNYLNRLKGLKTYVKPFINSNYDNCSVFTILKKMNHLKIIYDMLLLEFLETYHPAAIIMEEPSQPLFEVLHMDVEIFLMNSELHPYEEQALCELKRRVHFAYDTGELIFMLELYISGKLQKKRDQTFFNHYVYKENTKENIFKLIDQMCQVRG